MEKAIISVIGKDTVGILAKVAAICADRSVNVLEVTQNVLQDNLFAMIMIVDITTISVGFSEFADTLSKTGSDLGLDIKAMHEEIFNSMHKI